MTERPKAESTSSNPEEMPVRKVWHAPGFVVMDMAETDIVGNGGTDGGTMSSPS